MDDAPNWNDVYTVDELVAALRVHTVKIAKMHGAYSMAQDIGHAADCIEELADKLDAAARKAENLMAGIDEAHIKARAALETLSRLP